MTIFLTQHISGNDDNVGAVGALTDHHGNGWTFISYIQRGNGRALRPTAEAAIPKWFKGYVVDAASVSAAVSLTIAYRKGEQWADEAAENGLIKIIY